MTRLSNHALQSEKRLLYPSCNVVLLLHYPTVHLFPSHQAFSLTQRSLLLLFFNFDLKNSLELAYAAYHMQHLLRHIMSLHKKHISSFGHSTVPHWKKKKSSGLVNCAAAQNVTESVLRVHVFFCEYINFLSQAPILSSSPDPLCDLWPFCYYNLPS